MQFATLEVCLCNCCPKGPNQENGIELLYHILRLRNCVCLALLLLCRRWARSDKLLMGMLQCELQTWSRYDAADKHRLVSDTNFEMYFIYIVILSGLVQMFFNCNKLTQCDSFDLYLVYIHIYKSSLSSTWSISNVSKISHIVLELLSAVGGTQLADDGCIMARRCLSDLYILHQLLLLLLLLLQLLCCCCCGASIKKLTVAENNGHNGQRMRTYPGHTGKLWGKHCQKPVGRGLLLWFILMER